MDLTELWTNLIRQIKSYPNVNASQIDAFFSRVQLQAASQGFVMFTSDNSFIKDWIEKHYIKDIQQALKDMYGTDFVVQIEVDPTSMPVAPLPDAAPKPEVSAEAPSYTKPAPAPLQETPRPDFQREVPSIAQENSLQVQKPHREMPSAQPQKELLRYEEQVTTAPGNTSTINSTQSQDTQRAPEGLASLTFETFVMGDSNRMAYSMAVEVAEKPGSSALNPLFIYGRSGVGKTHLLCAIKNYINEQYEDFKVIYIDSMELVNRYSDAAIEKNVDKQSFKNFENFFQQADVLLIDDIQGLQGKPGTLDTLFRIFNKMIPKGKQFVFSADRAPKNIDLDERYVSRFNSGATIDIQPPDDETKRNIIKSFIAEYKNEEDLPFTISDSILDYIVDNSSSNIRELKSAITNVIFALKMDKEHELSESRVKELLGNHFIGGGKKRITIEMVQGAVEDFYGVAHKDLVGKKKERRIVHPRQVAIYLCRELSETTLKNIGNAFNRDHTTVMHSCDLITNQLQEDRNLREELEAIREKIRIQQY